MTRQRRLPGAGAAAAVACAALAAGSLPLAASPAWGAGAAGQHRPPGLALAAVGDTILGNTPTLPDHPRRYLRAVRPALHRDADVVFGNLEGTLTDETDSKCGSPPSSTCYAFRNPPSYAGVLADLGFTAVSTANNHSHDFGAAGFRQTRQVLDGAGLVHSGAPGEIGYLRREHLRMGLVAFAPYGDTNDMLDRSAAEDLVRRAGRR